MIAFHQINYLIKLNYFFMKQLTVEVLNFKKR